MTHASVQLRCSALQVCAVRKDDIIAGLVCVTSMQFLPSCDRSLTSSRHVTYMQGAGSAPFVPYGRPRATALSSATWAARCRSYTLFVHVLRRIRLIIHTPVLPCWTPLRSDARRASCWTLCSGAKASAGDTAALSSCRGAVSLWRGNLRSFSSVHSPSQVDIFDDKGSQAAALSSELMTAIPSRCCVHASLPLLAAATASGRMHVYR